MGKQMSFLQRLLVVLLVSSLVSHEGCGHSKPGSRATEPGSPEESQQVVSFADSALAVAVRATLGLQVTNPITDAAVETLTTLQAGGRGIADLSGMEALVAIAILNLSGNRIRNLEPLSGLQRLVVLDLSGNQVEDLGPIAALPNLQELYVSGNQISDLSGLIGHPALAWLDVRGNPLSTAAAAGQLPELLSQGVTVAFDPPDTIGEGSSEGPAGPASPCEGLPVVDRKGSYTITRLADVDRLAPGTDTCFTVKGGLFIGEAAPDSLGELRRLVSVGEYLRISEVLGLRSINLRSLVSVGERFTIEHNPNLKTLEGLEHLRSVGAFLLIESNDSLQSLQGLERLQDAGPKGLHVINNPLLPESEVERIVQSLSRVGYRGPVNADNNGGD